MPTLTRPTRPGGRTIKPVRHVPPSKPAALLDLGQSGKPQTRARQATKRYWWEEYPPMLRNASVEQFLADLDQYQNEGTAVDVPEVYTAATITAVLKYDVPRFEADGLGADFVVGLRVEYWEA